MKTVATQGVAWWYTSSAAGTSNSFAALADGSGSMANVTGSTVHTDLTVGEFSSWAWE